MTILLWLDDERDPADERWHGSFPIKAEQVIWIKSYQEFTEWIETNGLPAGVCFDHDLGTKLSGLDAARWLANYCGLQGALLPRWNVHSANPVGKANIISILRSFERVQDSTHN